MKTLLATLPHGPREVQLEYRLIAGADADAPVMVFMHEGLGSVAMWRAFPDRICAATGCAGLVYSRPGYGRSTPRAPQELWAPDFMHRQAWELLPALLRALHIHTPPWLLGHSDGGSIALLHAARHPVAGCVLLAPHILVEPMALAGIARIRESYLHGDLRTRLARYHDDPDSAFWGWNDAWLNPPFSRWNIEAELAAIRAPMLVVQGLADEYGALEQLRGFRRRAPHAELLELPGCGHAPHRERHEEVVAAVAGFVRRHEAMRRQPSSVGQC